jgi:transcriptional regulator with XRE-family HTH domain
MWAACMTPNKPIPPETLAFARKLKELTAGETQTDIGRRLGFAGSYISQIQRGQRPSRNFVERLVEAYGVDREEWLRAAGFRPVPEEQEDERMEIARRAAAEILRQTQGPPLDRIRAASRELQYERDPESTTPVEAFEGSNIHPDDLPVLESIAGALEAERRHKQGR